MKKYLFFIISIIIQYFDWICLCKEIKQYNKYFNLKNGNNNSNKIILIYAEEWNINCEYSILFSIEINIIFNEEALFLMQ